MKRAYDLREIAEYLDVQLRGDGQCQILSISSLETAREGDISFLANPAYNRYLQSSKASAVLLTEQDAAGYSGNVLLTNNPYVSYARVSRLFDRRYQVVAGVAAGASVANSARVGGTSQVAAGAVIDAGAVVGEGCHIGPGSYVGRDTVIGDGSYLHANVTVSDGISIGRRATIHSGAVIGADGFGFAPDGGGWVKIYQLGGVVIGDDVEIGAGTTIDRGALGNTIIGNGVKIDNLVQIAHNVQVGDNSALAGCAAIAGSSRIGRNCVLAGGAGLVGHITLCDNVTITGRSVITKSIDKPGIYSSGTPFEENRQWRKNAVRFGQLDTMAKRLSALEKQKKN